MGQLSRKVVNLSFMGASATLVLVGTSALIVTGIIVIIGLVVIYKILKQPTVNINIG